MEHNLYHSYGVWNFEVAYSYLENFCTLDFLERDNYSYDKPK
jgi:hypothetical protein